MAAPKFRRQPPALSPFLLREVHGRWRQAFGPLTLFLYTALLAYLTWQVIQAFGQAENAEISLDAAPGRRFLGSTLPWITAVWLLLAPIVTCGAISQEREHGMLAGLILTGLSPEEIVRGKWFAALAFQMVLLLVPAPIWLVGFCMGGVEPWEVGGAVLVQMATAAAASALGIACSAWANTSFQAYGRAFAALVMYALFSLPFLGPETAPPMAWASPLSATIAIFSDGSSIIQTVMLICGLAGLTWLLLYSAAQGVQHMPYEPPGRTENAAPTTTDLPVSSRIRTPQRPHPSARPLNVSVVVEPAPPNGLGPARATIGHRSRWEHYPVRNAVARREIRRRTRREEAAYIPYVAQRAMPWAQQRAVMWVMLALGLLLGLWIQFRVALVPGGLAAQMAHDFRPLFSLAHLLLVPGCLAGACFGASTFSREREQGTLHEVTNLPLPSWEITGGFLEASLWLILAAFPQLLALLPVALLFVPFYLVAAWVCFAVSLVAASICAGLFFSWIGHHTNLAISGSLAAIVGYAYLWLPGLPRDLLSEQAPARWFVHSQFFHTIQPLLRQPGDWGVLAQYGSLALLHFLLAALLFGVVTLGLDHTRRERQNPLTRRRA